MMRKSLHLMVIVLVVGCGDVEGKNNAVNNTAANNGANNGANNAATNSGSNNTTSNNIVVVNNGLAVPDDTVVSELTDGQQKTLCDEFDEAAESAGVADLECLGEGYFDALETGSMEASVLQAACTSRFNECKSAGSQCAIYTNCSGTAGDLRTCELAQIEDASVFASDFPSCESVTYEDLQAFVEVASSIEDPAECADYEATCD